MVYDLGATKGLPIYRARCQDLGDPRSTGTGPGADSPGSGWKTCRDPGPRPRHAGQGDEARRF